MTNTAWPELGGKEIRYRDERWELTGDVTVQDNGEILAVDVTAVDDVRHENATIYFTIVGSPKTLNPGNLGEHFDSIDREGRRLYLTVKTEGRRYRYQARRIELE